MPSIRSLTETEILDRAPILAEILIDCVAGGASVHFLKPPSTERAIAFWQDAARQVGARHRLVLVAEDAAGQVAGTVQLLLCQPENQPHRAEIAKLLVHRRARGAGLGTALMRAAEAAARDAGKSLLLLDTAADGDADRLYRRLGWTEFGTVPGYALDPSGTPQAARFFYRALVA